MRDYLAWHDRYDDPASGLPWRLAKVQDYLRAELDARPGPLRVLSLCAGDGRDLLDVLDGRIDAGRVSATLVEVHPQLVAAARAHAAQLDADVDLREADAGRTDAYGDSTPVDVLVVVGVLGNISDDDIDRTVDAIPELCAVGALVIWSRGLERHPDNDGIRAGLRAVGCAELDYAEHPGDSGRTSVGAVRFTGEPRPLSAGRQLFTFVR